MFEKEVISIIRKYVFENSEKDDVHGFLNVERVLNLCLQLGKELGNLQHQIKYVQVILGLYHIIMH